MQVRSSVHYSCRVIERSFTDWGLDWMIDRFEAVPVLPSTKWNLWSAQSIYAVYLSMNPGYYFIWASAEKVWDSLVLSPPILITHLATIKRIGNMIKSTPVAISCKVSYYGHNFRDNSTSAHLGYETPIVKTLSWSSRTSVSWWVIRLRVEGAVHSKLMSNKESLHSLISYSAKFCEAPCRLGQVCGNSKVQYTLRWRPQRRIIAFPLILCIPMCV